MKLKQFEEIVRKQNLTGERISSVAYVYGHKVIFRCMGNVGLDANFKETMKESDFLELLAEGILDKVRIQSPEIQFVTDDDMWELREYESVKTVTISFYVLFLEDV